MISNNTGNSPVLPVIVTDDGVLESFARFLSVKRTRSRQWQDDATKSVQLLIEFMASTHGYYQKPRDVFVAFANALFTGTIESYSDPSGLYWRPRSHADASKIISHITTYTDWLAQTTEISSKQLNPWRSATRQEERMNWAAYCHRRDNAFLSHLWRNAPETHLSREIRARTNPIDRRTAPKAFPEHQIDRLLTDGFRRSARDGQGRKNLRDVLITMLMNYGGLRLSEAMGLWSEDVTFEKGEVVVRVHHPEMGLAPNGKKRSVFLDERYGLKPRKQLVKAKDPLFLGWKKGLITDPIRFCFEVFFFPHSKGVEFAELWREYHLRQRVEPALGADHPYAFTSRDGQPYSHRMYRKALRRAVNRIGLVYEKIAGTTPHGHRHAYGQRLREAGADPLLIKNAMHHASIKSAEIYTQPTPDTIRQELRGMESRLMAKHASANIANQEKP